MTRTLTTAQLADLARITKRTAQWWDDKGLVVPVRVQLQALTWREYDEQACLKVLVLADLRRRNIGSMRLRKAARAMPADLTSPEWLLFNGSRFVECLRDDIAAVAAEQPGGVWLVELESKQRRVRLALGARERVAA